MNEKIAQKNSPKNSPKNSMWGGRFNQAPDAILKQINNSLNFDKNFFAEDIQGSLAHCEMLVRQAIISSEDGRKIMAGLHQIHHEITHGLFVFDEDKEDIQMSIEARLAEIIGDAAGRLHTARSRNDQCVTGTKLWLKKQCQASMANIIQLRIALLHKAKAHYDWIMPGFTHLQTAQPITLGHHLMAYDAMFARDYSRFADCLARHDTCPLGAGALAGTSFKIDRQFTAQKLGFNAPCENSMDAVASRDFPLEFLSIAQIHGLNLSRIAEEFVIWSSYQFQFIKFSDKFSTGSSIMPQKRNPDAAELVRAKVSRICGALQALAMVIKGLPLTYSKDLQEDKEGLMDAVNNLNLMQAATTGMIKDFSANREKLRQSVEDGFATATDAADWLVQACNIPFRQAHHIAGALVKYAESHHKKLWELSLSEMQAIDERITNDIFTRLSIENSVASRDSFGGTAPKNILKMIKKAMRQVEKLAGT